MKIFLLVLLASGWVWAEPGTRFSGYDHSRARPLSTWKPAIAEYCRRHYGEAEWQLQPKCVVLHYTAGREFPWNLVNSQEFAGETPGLASHFVVDGGKIYQLLPPEVRSRAAFGINHRAINIEMVGADASDLMNHRKATMDTCATLVADLLVRFQIPLQEVYSHQQVARMNPREVPWVLDRVNSQPYDKVDPGVEPMRYILTRVRQKLGG